MAVIDIILDKIERDAARDPRWAWRALSYQMPAQRVVVRVFLSAHTHDEPPRFFMTRIDIPKKDLIRPIPHLLALLESHFANLSETLDTFLDERCKCVPASNGMIGDHCEFHKGIYGY